MNHENGNGIQFYLRKGEGGIYGPVDRATIKDWARQGRVAPEDAISKDRQTWYPAPTLAELDMNWMVELPDGNAYGPIHLFALRELASDGSISADARVTNRLTEVTMSLDEALSEPGEAPEPPQVLREEEAREEVEAAPAEPEPEAPPAAPEPAAAAPVAPPPRDEWRTIAESRDHFQKDAEKWKRMYEGERESGLQQERTYTERAEELRRSEAATRLQLEQTQRRLRAAEDNLRLFRETLEANASDAQAGKLAALMEAYGELSQRYDSLMQMLTDKSAEIESLLESRGVVEQHAEEQIKHMQEIARREREEADKARRRIAEFEQTHMQLVKSYRELNDRYIKMRQDAPAGQPMTNAAEPSGDAKLRLTRSKNR